MLLLVALEMNVSDTRGARIWEGNIRSGCNRGTDVFKIDELDVFSHLLANQQSFKIGNIFYGNDGNLILNAH